jgi:hypothetical protein
MGCKFSMPTGRRFLYAARNGREVWQSLMPEGSLLRVIIDVDRSPPEIVTVYRTSKISKYWRVIDERDV